MVRRWAEAVEGGSGLVGDANSQLELRHSEGRSRAEDHAEAAHDLTRGPNGEIERI